MTNQIPTPLALAALTAAAKVLSEDPDALIAAPRSRVTTKTRRYAFAALIAAGMRPSDVARHFGLHPAQVTRGRPNEDALKPPAADTTAAVLHQLRSTAATLLADAIARNLPDQLDLFAEPPHTA